MFNLRFKDIFDLSGSTMTPAYSASHIILNVLVALFCGLFIYGVYKKTHSGVLFSRNLGVTLVIVSVITSLIVMAISGNIALSLGMIGALSIIRFRTPIKDPRDLAFLFWSVTSGVICGIAAYKLALISAVFVGVCLWALSLKMGWSSPYLLVLHLTGSEDKDITRILKENCTRHKERSSTFSDQKTEIIYEVVLRKITSLDLLKKIKKLSHVTKAVMVSYEGELDETR